MVGYIGRSCWGRIFMGEEGSEDDRSELIFFLMCLSFF